MRGQEQVAALMSRGLRKTYFQDAAAVRALDGVDLEVRPGEFLAVMGPSGSGKSTLLHMLGALDGPDEGEVWLNGRTINGLSATELAKVRRREVGFVFQLFNLVAVLTVGENIELPLALEQTDVEVRRSRVGQLLEQLGLSGHRDKLPAQLSGGEQQRAAIGRALAARPAVVLADEPTGNLDRATGREVMEHFAALHESGQTIVIVTHDPGVAAYARRVVFMVDGKLVGEVTPARRGSTKAILDRLSELEGA